MDKQNLTVSRNKIDQALTKCIDPELGIDIVNLGLIYGVSIKPERIQITMTLTTPGCPLVPYLRQRIVEEVSKATGIKEVEIILTFDPPWTPDKISAAAKVQLTMLRG